MGRERGTSVSRWLYTPAHAGSSLADFSTLKTEALRSSETSVHTRSTRRHIPEDGILHSHRRENLKSYINSFISESRLTSLSFNKITFYITKSLPVLCCHETFPPLQGKNKDDAIFENKVLGRIRESEGRSTVPLIMPTPPRSTSVADAWIIRV
jgi:hypothetical protein